MPWFPGLHCVISLLLRCFQFAPHSLAEMTVMRVKQRTEPFFRFPAQTIPKSSEPFALFARTVVSRTEDCP